MLDMKRLLEKTPSIPAQYHAAPIRLVVSARPRAEYFGLAPDMVCDLAAPDAAQSAPRLLDSALAHNAPVFLDAQESTLPLHRLFSSAGVRACVDISRYSVWNMFDRDRIRADFPHLERAYALFADEASRDAFRGVLGYRITGDAGLLSFASYPVYRHPDVCPTADDVFIDGGAFVGDTLHTLLPRLGGLRGLAFEPDPDNFARLRQTIERLGLIRHVRPLQAGLWKEDGEISFARAGDSSHIVAAGAASGTVSVPVRSLDSVAQSLALRPSFVKLDVEGAEFEALQGAERVVSTLRPKLAVCLYHRPEHLWQIPLWLAERGYRTLHLGHHTGGGFVALDVVLYARGD